MRIYSNVCLRFWLFALSLCVFYGSAQAETLPPSDRVVINLGQTPWKYVNADPANAQNPTGFDDSGWATVGIPYSADQLDTFINAQSGGGDGFLGAQIAWYRHSFTMAPQYANSKVLVEFEGAHTGAQVYINGVLLPGISAVPGDAKASHVVGFVPFIVDLTPYLKFDGATQNVLAVRVGRDNSSFFKSPGFSEAFRFGQSDLGLFRPVKMFITNKVHIPENVYSNLGTWGTYVATVSASDTSALVKVQTNVVNEGTSAQDVTLTTQIVDAGGNVVAQQQDTQTVAANVSPGLHPQLFDQQLTVNKPTLWYPNNSIYGKPYMYKVFHTVSVNGAVVDSVQSPLGIRTITWDKDFPYINGKMHYLWGGSGRYDYPALGTSVPEEQQWRDLQQMAEMGGNLWRPGHSTSSEEFVNAADAYGVMIVQPSGEGEGAFFAACTTPPCDMQTLKSEIHRDMIVRDRNHPSILAWEADNGPIDTTFAGQLKALTEQWDPVNTRVQADRTPNPANGDILSCTKAGCEVGVKQANPNNPAWGAEYWDNGTARQAYDYELTFASRFLNNWKNGREANAFGMAQWYFADSPGEGSDFWEGLNSTQVRSLGASMVDMNRFPKLLYYAYEAAWVPFEIKPVVHLAHHWNRTGAVTVNAFSNCPKVRLLISGTQQGSDQTPNPWNSDSTSNLTQTTTSMPFQVHWDVNWAAGTLTAQCLDKFGSVAATDSKITSGSEDHIELSVVPELVRPDGTSFAVTANGSDAAFVVAKVVDAQGNVYPTASDNITFSVTGPATYMGGSEQYVTPNEPITYHSPGDHELQAEGGLTKIALRTQFTPGDVTVTATAAGLKSGTAKFTIQPIANIATTASAPEVVVAPANTAVTAGQPATFTVTAAGAAPLAFQWSKNGSPIAGATSATYTVPTTALSDNNATFSVVVSNSLGTTPPAGAVLTVQTAAAPAVTTQPAAATAVAGQTASFMVAATGSPTLKYQWRKNDVAIPGATGASYVTPVLSASDNKSTYSVAVTNPVSTAISAEATLTVSAAVAPAITAQPVSLAVQLGQPASFTVGVSGSAPLTYVWSNGTNSVGTNSPTLSFASTQSGDFGNYSVTVTNAGGSVTSATVTLAEAPPGINLALGKVATASTVNDPASTPAAYAIDGNLTSRWDSREYRAPNGTDPGFNPDPSWIQINFGAPMTFNRIILRWEAAYARQYQIQTSNDGQTWSAPVYTQNSGNGGAEDFTFPTVRAQYVRMTGTVRGSNYGYSLFEFEVYNSPTAGAAGSTERYVVQGPNSVLDTLSGLMWQRAEYTLTAQGAQFTQTLAANYCSGLGMRLPTRDEALAISNSNASIAAFPSPWLTWTSTLSSQGSASAYWVESSGDSQLALIDNFPGGALCTQGPTAVAPAITTQPQAQSVAAGQTATFTVASTGTGNVTYEWFKGSTPVSVTGIPQYTTAPTTSADNGAVISVVVVGGNGLSSAPSTPASLTVTGTAGTGGGGGGTGTGGGTGSGGGATGCPSGGTNTGAGDVIAIAAGGAGTGSFLPDQKFSGGGTNTSASCISTAGVANAAPEAVYQSERAGNFTYTISGLTPGASYTVRLHFAEYWFTAKGQRVFNVSINNTTVLPNYDIIVDAGGPRIAVVRTFTATPDKNNQIVINFTAASADQPKVSGIEVLAPSTTAAAPASAAFSLSINSGGGATGNFVADTDASGGGSATTQNTINTSGVSNAAPASVYQSERAGVFKYTIPGLTAGTAYTVRLHFAEFWWTKPTQRVFNVGINNTVVLPNFDILAYAAPNTPLVRDFTATPDANNNIVVSFTTGSADQPKLSGIEIIGAAAGTGGGSGGSGGGTGGSAAPTISTQPSAQTASIGATAQFSVVALGTAPLTYQWRKNGIAIPGATAPSYTTPGTISTDNNAAYSVVVSNATKQPVTSANAVLTVNSSPQYVVYPGYVGTDLHNNTNGKWPDDQIYVEILGCSPVNNKLSWVNYDGTANAVSVADNTAANSVTGPDGKQYPKYSFTLADSKLLKLPYLSSGRIYISEGSPMYMPVMAGSGTGCGSASYAGPNPQNPTDPNINVHYDWYEFTYGSGGIYINTTQVDEFGLPLLLDVWGSVSGKTEAFHMQTGINESIAAIDQEFLNETPGAFHGLLSSNLRIFAPANGTFNTGQTNGAYFDSYINDVWSYYATNTLTVDLNGGARRFTGNTQGTQFVFTEVNLNNGAYVGGNYSIGKPTTENIFHCDGVFNNDGNNGNGGPQTGGDLAIEAQFCGAFNRHVMENYSTWATPAAYYQAAPANYYAQFWHNHSVGGLAYGFAYDDTQGESSTISTGTPEHMSFGIGW